jgi:hypothetical protein
VDRDILDALALERREDGDRDLGARGALALGDSALELSALGRLEQARVVVDPGGRRGRKDEDDGDEGAGEKQG